MTQDTYQVRKPVKVGADFRQPGELVPEAKLWFRVDHLVHAGFITQVTVSDEDFDAAVDKYCPEQREQLTASTEELAVQDQAAKKAYEEQILMATDPRRALTERHAAPPMTEDASRNDALAAASLRAGSVDEATTEIIREADEGAGKARKTARKKAEELTEDEVQVEGASEQFKADLSRDERTEELERGGAYDEKQASETQRVDEARKSGDTDEENRERASSTGRNQPSEPSEQRKQEQAKQQGQKNR